MACATSRGMVAGKVNGAGSNADVAIGGSPNACRNPSYGYLGAAESAREAVAGPRSIRGHVRGTPIAIRRDRHRMFQPGCGPHAPAHLAGQASTKCADRIN